jgi:phospho-N-acetylmuramoyl-pentapeptide-transferase
VNLTDGLDGLAPGCTILCAGTLAVFTYVAGNAILSDYFAIPSIPGAGEVAVLLAALAGAMLGFLWFNCFPARVFMGDAGSLPTGGLLAYAALVSRQEALFLVCGGVFVAETLSVVAQIGSRKLFGRKPLLCAPLHNHYLFQGHHEQTITVRFWIVAALLAVLALAMLKLR